MSTGNTEQTPQLFEFVPPPQPGGETADQQAVERAKPQETQKQAPQAQPPAVTPPVAPPQPPSSTRVPPVDDSTAQAIANPTHQLPAEESDLIEKEWVQRAKHIVATTQDDPHKQKSEISKAKADYIQKRFNKTIKIDDSFDKAQSTELSRMDDTAAS